jgi:hypothetical protein
MSRGEERQLVLYSFLEDKKPGLTPELDLVKRMKKDKE